jgi:hypothetical protein
MDMNEINDILMGKIEGSPQAIDYARGVGKATAVIWGMLIGMAPEDRKRLESILRNTAKPVEYTAVPQ